MRLPSLANPSAYRVPTSKWTTIHKNLTLSLTSAEGFLMTSEWAKANMVGSQLVSSGTNKAWEAFLYLLPLLFSDGFLALVGNKSQRRKTQMAQVTEPFP